MMGKDFGAENDRWIENSPTDELIVVKQFGVNAHFRLM